MELLRSRIVWEGRWRLRVETFRLSDGTQYERGLIEHPGAVALLPLQAVGHNDYEVFMLRQYRPSLRRAILEIPAGTREPDEAWLDCAQRELQEEIGCRSARLVPMGTIWPAPGITDEQMSLYLAFDLTPDPLPQDIDEEIAVEIWRLGDLAQMATDGRLEDAKSVVAVLRAVHYLGLQADRAD